MPSFPPLGGVTVCEINRDLGMLWRMRCRMIEPRRPTAMSSEWSSARFLSSWMLLLPITSLLPSMKLRLSQDKFSPVLQTNALPFQRWNGQELCHFIYRRREIQSSTQEVATLVEQRAKSATSLQEIDTQVSKLEYTQALLGVCIGKEPSYSS